ncbi:unnamed protein product [Rangifer tarandus platyrhynchus]|uniref:Uncharacterized protein n=1 Tax=Rangifer tarandus platyrhynchus TaxID=3082113 RepID=A0ABN8XLY6_RANTA|nr:unnamed protein product [Rangifer tarandus platyrhynchus]
MQTCEIIYRSPIVDQPALGSSDAVRRHTETGSGTRAGGVRIRMSPARQRTAATDGLCFPVFDFVSKVAVKTRGRSRWRRPCRALWLSCSISPPRVETSLNDRMLEEMSVSAAARFQPPHVCREAFYNMKRRNGGHVDGARLHHGERRSQRSVYGHLQTFALEHRLESLTLSRQRRRRLHTLQSLPPATYALLKDPFQQVRKRESAVLSSPCVSSVLFMPAGPSDLQRLLAPSARLRLYKRLQRCSDSSKLSGPEKAPRTHSIASFARPHRVR